MVLITRINYVWTSPATWILKLEDNTEEQKLSNFCIAPYLRRQKSCEYIFMLWKVTYIWKWSKIQFLPLIKRWMSVRAFNRLTLHRKTTAACEFAGFYDCAAEDIILLGHGAVSVCEWYPILRDHRLPYLEKPEANHQVTKCHIPDEWRPQTLFVLITIGNPQTLFVQYIYMSLYKYLYIVYIYVYI